MKIQETIHKTYISRDGRKFEDENSCLFHEQWLDYEFNLDHIPHITLTWDSDMPYTEWYYVSSAEEAQLVERSIWAQERPKNWYLRALGYYSDIQFPAWVGYEFDDSGDSASIYHTSLIEQLDVFSRVLRSLKSIEALTPENKG